MNNKVQGIQSKMQIVDCHSQSIAKLETQLRQLAIAVSKREEGKLASYPIENPKNQQFEQLTAIMVLKGGKEVENKVSEKKHDKKERLKTNEIDYEIESDSHSPLMCLTPLGHTNQVVPYPQALDAPFPFRKDKHGEDMLKTFKQVKVNLPPFGSNKSNPYLCKIP